MFKPQFAWLVERGEKLQTVRPVPKRMPKVGDKISARAWTGKPYRSKQRVLMESTICAVEPVEIAPWTLKIGRGENFRCYTHPRDTEQLDAFARADGFADFGELFEWFAVTHGLPFEGVLISWMNASVMARPDGGPNT